MKNRDIVCAIEKAVNSKREKDSIKMKLKDCEKHLKECLGEDVTITLKSDKELKMLSYNDIESISRTLEFPDKIVTSVKFKDGTITKAVLNSASDTDDKEKAVMWCLLKKCFASKRGLEKIIYSTEGM